MSVGDTYFTYFTYSTYFTLRRDLWSGGIGGGVSGDSGWGGDGVGGGDVARAFLNNPGDERLNPGRGKILVDLLFLRRVFLHAPTGKATLRWPT